MTKLFYTNKRKFSIVTLIGILLQLCYPSTSYALTGGPSQIEYDNFEPAGATEMVNLATGDFVYNIPLLDVDGYPINISYHGGVSMEQESGWVGLGWSLNPGSINRGLRGLPDDFNGGTHDKISEQLNIRNNETWGAKIGGGFETIGFDPATLGVSNYYGITYNNYKGLGLEFELGFSGSIQAGNLSATGNLGVNVSSQDGADFTMSGGLGVQASLSYQGIGVGGSLGIYRSQNYNSRRGLVSDIISGSAGANVSVYGATYGKTTGSSISLIPNTAYIPNLQYSSSFTGITGEIKVGGEFFWCNVHGNLRGYYFKQSIESPGAKAAYGYLNLENADYGSILDFNRDNDGPHYSECPKLPFSNLTYDVFNANAQGLNELFRPYRNDFGAVYDNYTTGGGQADDIGEEINIGSYSGAGINEFNVTTNSSSGYWSNIASASGTYFKKENQLTGTNYGRGKYEHNYFKALDEFYFEDNAFYNSTNQDKLSSFHLSGSGSIALLSNNITGEGGNVSYNGETKNNRQPRNSNMSYLSVAEASVYGLDKMIKNYNPNSFIYGERGTMSPASLFNRNFGISGIDHHISEVTILKEDGSRYIYGLPLYNKTHVEAVFNTSKANYNASNGLTTYGANDNTTSNSVGKDYFFMKKTVPSYAHSYLITALLSKDYVDIKNDGLSIDDYGDYTKFNYSQTDANYKWRVPMTTENKSAIFNPASYSENTDDKGLYVYGTKAQWYVHSIETKNYVAEFHISAKFDGHGADGEDGGISTSIANNTSYKLDKIVLFAKTDLNNPIKTVHFDYDYRLCRKTPNSTSDANGKLTLKKIYFTYGKSDKGVFSPYKFFYGDIDHDGSTDNAVNPNYDRLKMDRWGIYKSTPNSSPDVLTGLNNDNFPYTEQDSIQANINAHAWNLSTIQTPAGSKIDISYEADDYAYIQNRNPSQMLMIKGFSANSSSLTDDYSQYLYSTTAPYAPKNYMLIDLSKLKGGGLITKTYQEAQNLLKNVMLPGSGKLYFKAFVQIASGSSTQEFVPGYAEYDLGSSYVINNPTSLSNGMLKFTHAVVKLNDVDIEDSKSYADDRCNPISKAGWQIGRLNHPALVYPGSEPGTNGLEAIAALGSAIGEVFTFRQKNNRLRKKGYSSSINPSMSFVRMGVPFCTKIGGGHRVSKIEINDNWASMVPSEATSIYGQTYNYSLPSTNGRYLSSGVASYEPLTGGDEISLRDPVEFSVARIAAPDDAYFFEDPIGEAFYPQATIIYSKITVRNLERKDNSGSLIASNIGRTEYSFYTAKDFPIYSRMDGLQTVEYKPKPDGNLFSNYMETSGAYSQGFILKLNNMHGKLKSVLSYQEGNNSPISGTKYYYKTNANVNELNNTVSLIDQSGTITDNGILGQHVEPVADFRRSSTTTIANTQNFNINISPLPIPAAIPIPIPSYFSGSSTEIRSFYSATLSKVVNQQGILTKIETISDYASSTTENILWDSKTGNVVLSKTTTNYKDYDYSYETPSYWIYRGMQGAFENLGLGFKNVVDTTTGVITDPSGLLEPGDEVRLIGTDISDNYKGEFTDRLWINKDGNFLQLINRKGEICSTYGNNVFTITGATNYVLKVIKSGHKNLLEESSENITFSANPRTGNVINKTNNVIEASANELSDDWQQYCIYDPLDNCRGYYRTNFTANPYILNTKGNWNGARSYNYLGNRVAKNSTTGKFNIRKDGTFDQYKPFFTYSGSSWQPVYSNQRSDFNSTKPFDNWILNAEVTKISSEGNILESKDAINRYSSSLYGYYYTFKTANAVNAKYREIGFDGFEDADSRISCYDNHFNFYNSQLTYLLKGEAVTQPVTPIANFGHTGRHSIIVTPGGSIKINKPILSSESITYYGSNNYFPGTSPQIGGVPSSCASVFSPEINELQDQKYIFSLWIKEGQMNAEGTYSNSGANIYLNNVIISSLVKKSPIINGWQKFDYEFTIPSDNIYTRNLTFELYASRLTTAYFDDIRVHPYNASMNTYVYDPISLRLWAELDERNYTTFYEYDNEGVLVRVKRETEKGIITIKETANGLRKTNQN